MVLEDVPRTFMRGMRIASLSSTSVVVVVGLDWIARIGSTGLERLSAVARVRKAARFDTFCGCGAAYCDGYECKSSPGVAEGLCRMGSETIPRRLGFAVECGSAAG